MSKARNQFASTVIVIGALAGAFAMTQKITPGFQSLLASNASPSPTGSASASAGGSTAPDQTVQGDAVNYQFGTVQLEVVRKSGKISTINLLQSGATNGRQGAFSPLVQAAIQAQGTNFGNISGATYTVDAFKQALTSAMSKLK
jgi:uncharacterized protein with FMN-binding domain